MEGINLNIFNLNRIANKLIAEAIRSFADKQLYALKVDGLTETELELISQTVKQKMDEFEEQSGLELKGVKTLRNWPKIVEGNWKECLK